MYRVTITNGTESTVIHELDTVSAQRLAACSFTESAGTDIPTASFTIYPQNAGFEKLHSLTTLVTITNTKTGENEFEGRILQLQSTMDSGGIIGQKVTCEGYLAYLCDSRQPYRTFENTEVRAFLTELLNQHNALMPKEKQILMGQCDITGTASKTTAYRTTLDEIRENLVSRLGGELRVRSQGGVLYLDYMQQFGSRRDTKIQLARNLKMLTSQDDATSIITRLIPLGCKLNDETAERLTIESVNGGCPYIDDESAIAVYGVICGTYEWDDVTKPEHLLTKAKIYLKQNNRVKRCFKVTALDLSTIGLDVSAFRAGNEYKLENPLMGIDEWLRVVKRTVDIYRPYQSSIEIGDKLSTLTDMTTKVYNYVEYEAPKRESAILAQAKANATAIIQAGINGYVVVNPNEILVMDTPDKATASKVWRWNSGGFGYSSTGYDGEYGTAMTMDGAIVADFITAGVLRGIEISNGDGTFHVDENGHVSAAAIDITGGRINIATTAEKQSVITLRFNYSDTAQTECTMNPRGFSITSSATGVEKTLDVSSENITFYENGQRRIMLFGGVIEADGAVRGNNLIADNDVMVPRNGTSSSLLNWLTNIESRLTALEG